MSYFLFREYRLFPRVEQKKKNEGKPGKRLLKKKKDLLDIVISFFLFLLFPFSFFHFLKPALLIPP